MKSRVQRRPDLISVPVGDEIVMLDSDRDKYVNLNDVGAEIWERLATPVTVEEICTDLGRRFDGPLEQIATDVLAFIADLERRAIVTLLPEEI